jgi:EmrB/QacA subfamily drug resistance transporter
MVLSAPVAALLSQRRRWLALIVVCLAQLMNALDATIVNVALPVIQTDLHFSQANLTWCVDAYLVTFGSFLLLAGRLGDLLGRKRVFLSGVAIFTLASAACGLAHDQVVLIVARFVQGIGGAVSSSVIVAIIVSEFTDPLARARAMSTYIFVAVGGGSIGLLLGGVLTQTVDWHWIFVINLPIGLAAIVLGQALIRDNPGIGLSQGVDVLGSVLVILALMLGIYAIVEAPAQGWASLRTLGFGGTSIVLLVLFALVQSRSSNPILPPRILRLRGLGTSSAVRGLAATGLFASFFFSALYMDRVLGYGPLQTGLAFLPQTLAVGALSLGVTARLVQRFGPKRCTAVGLLTMLIAMVMLGAADEHTRYVPLLFVAFGLIGIGGALSFMPLLTIALAEVPVADAGVASGIVNVSMQLSAALGLAVLGSVATDRTRALAEQGLAPGLALIGGYQCAFSITAVCCAVGLLAALVLLPGPRTKPVSTAAETVRLAAS